MLQTISDRTTKWVERVREKSSREPVKRNTIPGSITLRDVIVIKHSYSYICNHEGIF